MPRVYGVNAHSKEKILRAAERLLRIEGVRALTTRRVAAEVGVSAMAMYRHFHDKEALLQALIAIGFQRWETRLAEAVHAATARARIENALRAYREFALDEPRLFELMFLMPRRGVSPARDSQRARPSPSFTAVIAAAEECTARDDDPGQMILTLWGLAHGLIALHFTGRFGFDAALFRRRYEECVGAALSRLSA